MLSSWKGCCAHVPQRWVFAVMGSLALVIAFPMQICLSLAITEMVTPSLTSTNSTVLDETCPSANSTSSGSSSGGTYEWDEYTQMVWTCNVEKMLQGVILSSYYWGFLVTQLPGGILAEKFGGKYVSGLGIFTTATLTLLTPIIVQTYDFVGLIVLRVLIGFGGGTTVPALSYLITQWAPPNERSKIGTLVRSGSAMGAVVGNALTGILLEYSTIGWPIVFYFFGALGIVWFLAWIVLCYSNPDVHPFIGDEEKKYLEKSTSEHTHRQNSPTPWRYILTSVPIWALLAAKFCYAWGFHTLMTDLPKYMSGVLKFSVKANGLLTALPYILKWLVSNTLSWLADWLITSEKMSRTNVRKVWFSITAIVPAVFIISASYAGCDRTTVVILFTAGITAMGFVYSSLFVNPNDLSPNYSGTIAAIDGVIVSLAGILAPYVVGVLTPNQTLLEWRVVFWISFVISWSAALIYNIWGQGEVQFWNNPKTRINQQPEIQRPQ